jgi:hypothetical protein
MKNALRDNSQVSGSWGVAEQIKELSREFEN